MKITKYFTLYSRQFTICLREYNLGQITITSHVPIENPILFQSPTISWASCGGQLISKVDIFYKALDVARSLSSIINSSLTEDEIINLILKKGHNLKDEEIQFGKK